MNAARLGKLYGCCFLAQGIIFGCCTKKDRLRQPTFSIEEMTTSSDGHKRHEKSMDPVVHPHIIFVDDQTKPPSSINNPLFQQNNSLSSMIKVLTMQSGIDVWCSGRQLWHFFIQNYCGEGRVPQCVFVSTVVDPELYETEDDEEVCNVDSACPTITLFIS